jgi:hypothetical protein
VARPVRSPLRAVDAIQNVSVAEDQRLLGDALEALAGTASQPYRGSCAGGRTRAQSRKLWSYFLDDGRPLRDEERVGKVLKAVVVRR